METNEAFSLSEEVPLRLLTLISLILLVPLVMLVSIVQLFELPVVSSELELLDESSFFAQEMVMRLKRGMRIMDKTLFIFSSIPKVKYYGLVVGEPNLYHNLEDFTRMWGFYLEGCLTVKN